MSGHPISYPNLNFQNMPIWGAIAAAIPGIISALGSKKKTDTGAKNSLIEAGGNIVGGVVNNMIARGNTKAQNRYNEPKRQLQRLREAGLPYAAFSDNQAGNQAAATAVQDVGIGAAGRAIANSRVRQQEAIAVNQLETMLEISRMNAESTRMALEFAKSDDGTGITNFTAGENAKLQDLKLGVDIKKSQAIESQVKSKFAEQLTETELKTARATYENILKQGGLIDEQIEGLNLDNLVKEATKEYNIKMSKAQWLKILQDTRTSASQETLNKAATALSEQNRQIQDANFGVENLTKWSTLLAQDLENAYNAPKNQTEIFRYELMQKAQDLFKNGVTLQSITDLINYGNYMAWSQWSEQGKSGGTELIKGLGRQATKAFLKIR